jgi:hypothetical protein
MVPGLGLYVIGTRAVFQVCTYNTTSVIRKRRIIGKSRNKCVIYNYNYHLTEFIITFLFYIYKCVL